MRERLKITETNLINYRLVLINGILITLKINVIIFFKEKIDEEANRIGYNRNVGNN
jgi:hypothetical protein